MYHVILASSNNNENHNEIKQSEELIEVGIITKKYNKRN